MAKNGPHFLERTKHEFLDDLAGSFGDRTNLFSDDLKILLFELWVRARSRAPFPEAKVEEPELKKQAEFDERLATSFPGFLETALEGIGTQPGSELRMSFAAALKESITVSQGITRLDHHDHLQLSLDPTQVPVTDQHQLAQALVGCIKLGPGLDSWHNLALGQLHLELDPTSALPGQVPGPGPGAGIPELLVDGQVDEDQPRLKTRLEALGVMVDANWVPVFQHVQTGARAAIAGGDRQLPREIETLLVYDNGNNWLFPNPKPVYTYDECEHIRFWVDGVEQEGNHGCTWSSSWDNAATQPNETVDHVQILGTTLTSVVRVRYSTTRTEYGV